MNGSNPEDSIIQDLKAEIEKAEPSRKGRILEKFEARPQPTAAARVARETECWYPRQSAGPDTTDPSVRERRR